MAKARGVDSWMVRLVAEDFSKKCKKDRFCAACLAGFCGHCCARQHQGHHTVRVAADVKDALAKLPVEAAERLLAEHADGRFGKEHVKDWFCVSCGTGFCAALCGHHWRHETVRIVEHDGRLCVRCTGSEAWFSPAFDGIMVYEDELGHQLVPLHSRSACGRN